MCDTVACRNMLRNHISHAGKVTILERNNINQMGLAVARYRQDYDDACPKLSGVFPTM